VFVFDGFGQETDDHGDNDADEEQDAAEVQVVDVLDDGRSLVVFLLPAWRNGVRVLPGEPN